MKKLGSKSDFIPQRNKELLDAFKQELYQLGSISNDRIFSRAAHRTASRFWVSEQRAAVVVSKMMKGDNLQSMNRKKREMYFEIFRRVMDIRKKNPKTTIYDAVFEVVNSPAPEFYLTDKSARVLIYQIRA